LPSKPGVYLFLDKDSKVIYVGKAKDLKKRVSSYFTKSAHDAKTTLLVSHVDKIEHIIVLSEVEAFLLEAALVKKHNPHYNIKLIDDKSYPYVCITKNDSPSVSIVRKKTERHAEYYGPFTEAGALKVVLKLLRKIFPYQSVKNHPKRKCLYFHLGLCPCIPVFPENLPTYKKNLKKLEQVLNGKKEIALKSLIFERDEFSKQEKFEEAQNIQNQIASIEKITSPTYDPFYYIQNPKGHIKREEEENRALQELLISYSLPIENLKRIECYDISNFQGVYATGSMTVFIKGSMAKQEYRKFKIKKVHQINDFAMHQEIMGRRLKRTEWEYPDLIIIDGGKGQVSSVMQVLAALQVQIPVIGLAKKFETIIVPERVPGRFEFHEVRLPLSSPAVNLVRRIRDEAHRFAISYHRVLRSKGVFENKK